MRDKVLQKAIIISIVVHLVAAVFIGRTSSTRLDAAVLTRPPERLIHVDFVKGPHDDPKPEPKHVLIQPKQDTKPSQSHGNPLTSLVARVFGGAKPSSPTPTRTPRVAQTPSKAGGALNTGTGDRNGDLHGVSSGRTPVGWVPGGEGGHGAGSGNAAGVGTPEPPRAEPVRHVESAPAPPSAPKRVTKRICEVSGLLAGDYCKHTRNETFNEGEEPTRVCDKCKAPEPVREPARAPVQVSRLADRKDPVLTHDVHPRIPDSLDEGLSLEVEIEYYVDSDGRVSGIRVSKSSGNRELDRAVTSAASSWRYSPAVQDGVARRVKVSRTIKVKT